MDGGSGSSHEVIFIRGLHPKKILRVVCKSESERTNVISECLTEGIKEHNGVPIEDFIVAEPTFKLSVVYEKYVKPAGF